MFEMNAAATDLHLFVWTIGQVDNFGRHLRRKTKEIGRPRTLGHDLPVLSPGNRLGSLVDVRAQLSTECWIHFRHVIKAAPDAPDGPILYQVSQRHVDTSARRYVQEVL